MRELFRQFMFVLIQEKTKGEEEHIYLDPQISFLEIDKYFIFLMCLFILPSGHGRLTDLRCNQEVWN